MTPAGRRRHRRVWWLMGLAVLIHALRSRRFYENVAVGATVLAAGRNMGQESRANTLARLMAWDKRQDQRVKRESERQAKRLGAKPA
jgi:hypothetical protein